jgi:excisionase family DNA binding protein
MEANHEGQEQSGGNHDPHSKSIGASANASNACHAVDNSFREGPPMRAKLNHDGPKNEKGRAPLGTVPTPKPFDQQNHIASGREKLLYTLAEVAEQLSLSERSVWSLCHSGQLSRVKIGRSIRVPAESIKDFIARATQ